VFRWFSIFIFILTFKTEIIFGTGERRVAGYNCCSGPRMLWPPWWRSTPRSRLFMRSDTWLCLIVHDWQQGETKSWIQKFCLRDAMCRNRKSWRLAVFQKSNIKGVVGVYYYFSVLSTICWLAFIIHIKFPYFLLCFFFFPVYFVLYAVCLVWTCISRWLWWTGRGGWWSSWTPRPPTARCWQTSWGPEDSPCGVSLCKKVL